MRIGIYILRPPQHSQVLLANAQIGWLRSPEASAMGWQSMPDVTSAQMRANLADLVLAAFENPDPDKPVTSRSSARARSTRRHCWRTAPLSPRPAAAMRFRCRSQRASPTTRRMDLRRQRQCRVFRAFGELGRHCPDVRLARMTARSRVT